MSFKLFYPKRTVLLMADDALYIYSASSKGAVLVETVPWDIEGFSENVARVLAKDCKGNPVLILNDMVEQHYRKERVLKRGVSIMDRKAFLERKLHVAYPSYPVKAALKLNEKIKEKDKAKQADNYIFAAVPDSHQFSSTIKSAKKSLASIASFCLLPVESTDMVKTLSDKCNRKKAAKNSWAIFIGQHKHEGLRQIVVKDGDLALTRMTPVSDMDEDTEKWASEVHQELLATMSYISRFGYSSEDSLTVMIIADASAGDVLAASLNDYNLYTMTAAEAAKMLSIPFYKGMDDRYADALHVMWAASKTKFILPMRATEVDKVSTPRRVAMFISLAMGLGCGVLGYMIYEAYEEITAVQEDIDNKNRRLTQLKLQYQKEVKRKEAMGFDVVLVQSSIEIYDELELKAINPLEIYNAIGLALGRDLRIDRISITREIPALDTRASTGSVVRGFGQQNLSGNLLVSSMQMTFPSTSNVDRGNQEVNSLAERAQRLLPDYNVAVTKRLKDYEYVEEIIVESGDLDRRNIEQDFVAEIRITKPLEEDGDD